MAAGGVSRFPVPVSLIAALAIGHVAFAGNRFTLTLHAVALGATPLQIGVMLALLMVVPLFVAVHIGRWSDRLGYAPLTLAGFGMLLAAGLIAGAWPVMGALYVASILTGTGYMLAHVAVNNGIGRVTDAARLTDAFSAMAVGFSISGLTGPLVAGFLIDHAGHRYAFLALSAFVACAIVLLRRAANLYPVERIAAEHHAQANVLDLLRHPNLQRVFVVSAMITMGWDLFTFLAPLQGVRAGLSATSTGLVVSSFAAGTLAIRLLLPRIMRRAGQWATLAGALLVTAVGYVAFPLLHNFYALGAAAFVLGMSLGCGQPVSMALVHLNSPAERAGEAVGLRSTITSASQTLLPVVFGAVGTALGVPVVFWIGSAMLAFGGAVAARKPRAS